VYCPVLKATQKIFYTTGVVMHRYVIGLKNSKYTRYHIELKGDVNLPTDQPTSLQLAYSLYNL